MTSGRRAIALVLVLVTLALVAALVVPLSMLSGVESLAAVQEAVTLRHRLAAESVCMLIPALVEKDRRLSDELDRDNQALTSFDLGDLNVALLIQDESAKLPAPLLAESKAPNRWPAAYDALQTGRSLVGVGARMPTEGRSLSTGCLEDLFERPGDVALFGAPRHPSTWARFISPIGLTVNLARADGSVLEAALQDVHPGLGNRLADARRGRREIDIEALLRELDLKPTEREIVGRRLSTRCERYSLLILTRLGNEVRQRYMICTAEAPPAVLVNWEVAP